MAAQVTPLRLTPRPDVVVPADIVQDFGADEVVAMFRAMRKKRAQFIGTGGAFAIEFDVHRDGSVAAGHVTTRERL